MAAVMNTQMEFYFLNSQKTLFSLLESAISGLKKKVFLFLRLKVNQKKGKKEEPTSSFP